MAKNREQHYKEKGERDRKYTPPRGLLENLLTFSSSGMKKNRKDNDAYDKGWRNKNRNNKK